MRVEAKNIRCYDNGGKTADRYCVVYMGRPENRQGCFQSVSMNHEPFHRMGIGQHGAAMPGRHLGKRIAFRQLPKDCQKLVNNDLNN